jgi:hypothetical protein
VGYFTEAGRWELVPQSARAHACGTGLSRDVAVVDKYVVGVLWTNNNLEK